MIKILVLPFRDIFKNTIPWLVVTNRLEEYFKNRKCPAAVELVYHLLKYDPVDRISAEDAL